MRDIASVTSPAQVIGPITGTTTGSYSNAVADCRGFDALCVEFFVGVGGITFDGTNRLDLIVEDSDDGTTWAPVVANFLSLGGAVNVASLPATSGIVRAITAAHAAPSVTRVAYVGNRRYLRGRVVFAGTHATATPYAVNVLRGAPNLAP